MHNDASVVRSSGTLEYLHQHRMTLQVWSPLQKGFFEGVFLNDPEYQELNDLLDVLAEKYQCGKDAIAYAWLLRLPQNVQVILGTAKKERLAGAAKAADIHLTRKEWYDVYKAAGNKLP
ncbi:MAG: aldo/keto reductase [Bulleidia sp.]|nr:aldo/keto reductase [Bulleidia sp.]